MSAEIRRPILRLQSYITLAYTSRRSPYPWAWSTLLGLHNHDADGALGGWEPGQQ